MDWVYGRSRRAVGLESVQGDGDCRHAVAARCACSLAFEPAHEHATARDHHRDAHLAAGGRACASTASAGAPAIPPTEPIEPAPFLVPEAEALPPPREYDWFGDARGVAGELGRKSGAGSSPFAPPEKPERKLKSSPDGPPPLFEKPLPRVGTTVRTPEGETILWVSDYCYISLGSTSLTMQDFHKAREGVRRCIIPLGKREPRGDLFDHLKK
jgi:hypothetical protein